VTLVDIAGYFDVFATFSVNLHVAAFAGATRRDETMEHGPDSDHIFLPLEMVFTNHVTGVFDFFAIVVFNTMKPGRTTTLTDEGLTPADVCDESEKEYSVPFVNPGTVQEVLEVVQTIAPLELATT